MGYSKAKTELVVTYIDALAPAWIKVMMSKSGEPAGHLQAGSGADIETDHPSLVMFDTLWFAKQAHADLVLDQCLAMLDSEQEGAILRPATEIRDCLVNVSGSLGAPWQTTKEVVDAAGAAVDEIEQHVEALKATGGLKQLNSGYKAYRLAMQGTGEAAINYSAYFQSFKVRAVGLIGRNVASGVGKHDGVLAAVSSLDNGLRDARRAQSQLKNIAYAPVDQLHHAPLHHTRNAVHHARRLKA